MRVLVLLFSFGFWTASVWGVTITAWSLDPSGTPVTSSVLDTAQASLQRALEKYDANDLASAQLEVLSSGRLLYGLQPPAADEGKRYAEILSKFSLLTLRLNRFLYEASPELEPERFTMPVPYNPRIERQIDFYVTTDREEFARWLRRSGRYVPVLREYFAQEGMPPDLVYIALVESGFNPLNRSEKQAVGMFQFVKDTADLVGLKEDSWVDERRHPRKAALAAIKHLKSLYQEFGDWDLALAAYNCGSGRVWKSIHDQGQKDYWKLALPPETEAYVPKFYATLIIAREPELYGFNPELEGPGSEKLVDEVEVPGGVDLKVVAQSSGTSLAAVAELNPELTKGCTPEGNDPYRVRLPAGAGAVFTAAFARLPDEQKFLSQDELGRRRFKGEYVLYTVKEGDSLYTIARKHHTTVAKVQKTNSNNLKGKYIHPGQKLRIYRLS